MIASTEELRLSQVPAAVLFELELSGQGLDARQEAQIMLHLDVRAESDGPKGAPYCGWCGRSDPPAHRLELIGRLPPSRPDSFSCIPQDNDSCMATQRERFPAWEDRQFPDWGIRYAALMDARRRWKAMVDWQSERAWGATHPEAIAAERRQLAMSHPIDPDALAAVRLAVEGRLGTLELSGPQSWEDKDVPRGQWQDNEPAWQPSAYDPWHHTIRGGSYMGHTMAGRGAPGPRPPVPQAAGKRRRRARGLA